MRFTKLAAIFAMTALMVGLWASAVSANDTTAKADCTTATVFFANFASNTHVHVVIMVNGATVVEKTVVVSGKLTKDFDISSFTAGLHGAKATITIDRTWNEKSGKHHHDHTVVVKPCGTVPTTTSTVAPTTTTMPETTTVPATTPTTVKVTTTTVPLTVVTDTTRPHTTTSVKLGPPVTAVSPPPPSLPRTGNNTGPLIFLACGLLAIAAGIWKGYGQKLAHQRG